LWITNKIRYSILHRETEGRIKALCLFCVIGNFVPITQKRSAGMRTAAYNADIASDRRRRKNVPRHILCSIKEDMHGK
jgi:hypothetical protein